MAKYFISTLLIFSIVLIVHGHYRNHNNNNRRNSVEDPCKLLPDRRACNPDVNVKRFYFDSESLQCRAFQYRGCPDRNTNNFVSQWDCLRSCLLKQGYRDALSKLVYGPSSLKKKSRSSNSYDRTTRSEDNRYRPKESFESNGGRRNQDRYDYHGSKSGRYYSESGADNGSVPPKSNSFPDGWFDKFGNKFTPASVTRPSLPIKEKSTGVSDSYDNYRIPADLSFHPESYNRYDTVSNTDHGDHFLSTYEEAKRRSKKAKLTYYGSADEYDSGDSYLNENGKNKRESYDKSPEYGPSVSDWELRKKWTGIPPGVPVSGFPVSPHGTNMPPVYRPSSGGNPVNFMTSFDMQRPQNLPKGYNGRHAVIKTPDSVVRIEGGRGKPLMFERHGKNSYAWYKEDENKKNKKQDRFHPPPLKPPPVQVPSNGEPPSGPGWFVEEIPGGYRAVKDDTKENGWKHTYTRIFLEHPSGLAGTSFWSMESEYDPTKGQGDEIENEIIREQRKIQRLEKPREDSEVVLSDLNNHFLQPMVPVLANIKSSENVTNDMTSTYTSQILLNTTKIKNNDNKTESVVMSAFISQKSSVSMNAKPSSKLPNSSQATPTLHTTHIFSQNNIQMDPSKHQTPPSKHAYHPVVSPNLTKMLLTPKASVQPQSTRVSPVVADSNLRSPTNFTLKGVLRNGKLVEKRLSLLNTTNMFTSLELDGGSGEPDDVLEEMTTPAYVVYAANFNEQSATPKKDSVDMVYDNLVPFTTPVYNSKADKPGKKTSGKQRIAATKKLTPQDAKRIVPPPLAFGGERKKPTPKKFKVVSQGISPPNMGQGEPRMKNIHEGYDAEGQKEFDRLASMHRTDRQGDYPRVPPSSPPPEFAKPRGVDSLEMRPEMTSSVLFADENQEILKETPSEYGRTPFDKPQWEPMQRDNGPNLSSLDLREGKIPARHPPMVHGPRPSHDFEAMNEAEMLIENALGPRQENPHGRFPLDSIRQNAMVPPPEPARPVVEERRAPPIMMNKPLIRTELPHEEHLQVAEPQTFPPACYQQVNPGPCRAMIRRWYYNSQHGRCMIFYYGGCEGNANSFNSEEQCMHACGGLSFSPIDAPLPERGHSMEPEARRFSYSAMPGKPEIFHHEEERQQERHEPRQEPEVVRGPEPPRNLLMPQQPSENQNADRPEFFAPQKPNENENADGPEFFAPNRNSVPQGPQRPDQERPQEKQENQDGNVLKKLEREEKPLNQMWPSFLQLLHRGLYMSAWRMQHRPTPAPTSPDTPFKTDGVNTEGSTFYITTTENPPEGVTDVKFTDKERLVTDNHNVAPTKSTLPSKEIPTVQPKPDEEEEEEDNNTEKEEESSSAEEVEDEETEKDEEEEDEDNRTEPEIPGPVQPKKGKKKNKAKKLKMRIKMVLPFMRIFLNKYQQKPRERLLSNLLSNDRPTMTPWGMRRMEEPTSPWRILDERPRTRAPQNKNGLTVMQVFMHKSEDETPWWARRRPQPSYYHRDMLPLSHSYGQPPQPQPHQEIHSHYSTIIYRPDRPSYQFGRPPYHPRPMAQSVMPFHPVRVVFRPNVLPPAGEPNMACLQPLEMGMCHDEESRNSGFRYYYNQQERTCSLFYHFGCRTNANNFATMQECADSCRVTTPKPTNEATTAATTVTRVPEINTDEPKMIEANAPVEEKELTGDAIVPSEVEKEPVEVADVSRSRVRFASEEEYATIIAILALGAAALLVLIILCSMHIFRRVKKSRTMKKGSIVEAVLRAHIFGELPGLPYGNKDMKKPDQVVPELPKPPQSTV